ncbi:crotonase/enoyl-CoA hydratase family protein [Nocardia sp. NPDC052278]|uniref:crotonase/enoyl-CoA hydratase family protein n=1 Tax=unclassified Nocardia TaxID=2637762 RepID=UPI0036D0CFA9
MSEAAARVEWTITDGIADVRLNRPEKLNALDDEMFTALIRTAAELRAEPDLRVVVLSGRGRGFCAGLDLDAFRAMAEGRAFRPADSDVQAAELAGDGDPELTRGQRAVLGFRNLPVPVIAAVHGPALGGGLQLALAAHIRFVAPTATLGLLEMNWGVAPDMGGTQLLPRLVGSDVAAEMILTARRVDGVEAERIGLATRSVAEPLTAAMELARTVAARNPDAVRALTTILAARSFAEGLAAERAALRTVTGAPNQREAAAAALEKRAPVFVTGAGAARS